MTLFLEPNSDDPLNKEGKNCNFFLINFYLFFFICFFFTFVLAATEMHERPEDYKRNVKKTLKGIYEKSKE